MVKSVIADAGDAAEGSSGPSPTRYSTAQCPGSVKFATIGSEPTQETRPQAVGVSGHPLPQGYPAQPSTARHRPNTSRIQPKSAALGPRAALMSA